MGEHSEMFRLEHFTHGERPPGLWDAFTIVSDDDIESCIAKVTTVMRLIASYAPDHWPDDESWRRILPDWLLKTFKEYTPEELAEIQFDRSRWSSLSWSFGSWLYMMRERDWQWWSIEREGAMATIYLALGGYPYAPKSLKHLITSAGGRILD